VLFDNHVAQIDPDAETDPALFQHLGFTVDHRALDLHGAADGIHHARELGKEAVAGVLYDAASVFDDLRINQFAEVGLEAFVRPLSSAPIKRE
jgi:hypothetical protein